MGCSPCLSTRIRCSWQRPTAPQPARRFTSRARHRRNTARYTEATTCLHPRGLFSPISLAGGSPRHRKPMPTGSRSGSMIRIDRLVPRVRAKSQPILRHKPAKRKRILYRRYLVSLEVRRRNPTRLSRSRRRETHHEQDSGGVSGKRSPSDSFDPLRRTIACRRPREAGRAARGSITTADAGGQFRDRCEAGAYRGAARGSVLARKDYREAAQVYKRLTDQNPQNPVYLNKLGIALHQQAALGQALKYYERASKADPSYADAQNNIATIWYQRKKYGKAIKAYHKAISIRGDVAVLHSNLAYAYFADKKYENAIVSFRQALALDPQLFEHNGSRTGSLLQDRSVEDSGRVYFLLAKSFAEAGNLERCLIYLRKAKDEGYKELSAVRTDPSFAAVVKDPAIQEVLAPKPPDGTQP